MVHKYFLQRDNIIYIIDLTNQSVTCLVSINNKEKQFKESFESKNIVSTSRTLELLHINLFGPTITTYISGKHYGVVMSLKRKRLCEELDILHNFSYPKKPQKNGVVERKNRSL
ncbi:hypothetical protein CR513_28809, partial [Mucuna pruriens]